MRRLFEAAGVDFIQWRALMRAYVWMDYGSLFGANGSAQAWRATTQFIVLWGLLSGLGLWLAAVTWVAHDPLFAAVMVVGTMMLWSGLMVIFQPASLASPVDHEIVSPRPVTSRTYFAVRFSAMLVVVLETSALMGWLPVVAFLTRKGGSLALAFAAGAAIVAGAVATTAGIVAVYGWLIRLVPPVKLTRLLAYTGAALSLAMTAVFTIGLYAMVESDDPLAFIRTTLPRDLRTYWFPGAWFASYVTIATGTAGRADLFAAAASGLSLALFATALGGRMSLDYAGRVSQLATTTAVSRAPRFRRGVLFRRHELRAVAVLIASHLRSDARFQLAVASNAMMGIIIVIGSSGFRMPVDPFAVSGHDRVGGLTMPLFALIMVPMQIYQTIASTTEHDASWLYYTTPGDRTRIITAARDTIALYVLLPLVCLLGGFYFYAYRHAAHAFAHTLFLAAIAYLSLQLTVLAAPRLPFTIPLLDARQQGSPMGVLLMLGLMIVMAPFTLILQHFAFRSRLGMLLALTGVGLLSIGVNVLTRRRILRRPPAY